jgi:diaminopimelate epimerase
MNFTKMQGLGNDFIIIENLDDKIAEKSYSKMSLDLCDRHFGIGADGLIFVLNSTSADYKMRIFNSDGTEAEMCGNGIRCFAKYIYEQIEDKKPVLSVETLAGIIVPTVVLKEDIVIAVEVDMGEPVLERSKIPMTGENSEKVIGEEINVDGKTYTGTAVSMGNPHIVFFVESIQDVSVTKTGPIIEQKSLFPERINVEFAHIVNEEEIVMRVWERGSGETLACGTGACATLVAAVLNNKTKRKSIVHLLGGELSVEWQEDDNHIIMTGPAETVFKGVFDEAIYEI